MSKPSHSARWNEVSESQRSKQAIVPQERRYNFLFIVGSPVVNIRQRVVP